jgi:hypothetical protein
MNTRIAHIASNTFREAVRDRVLYNLIAFALLLSGAAILVGQISIEIEKLVVINLGLTAVSLFGIVIAILSASAWFPKKSKSEPFTPCFPVRSAAGSSSSASSSGWPARWW